ncbi:VWA domain-containing protein [Actinomadura spongiicola]|uniref:VWA domain-containing protein n=2 Tax=Actinomadura spongiicola TaxID=2303421 RepID=A0A372GFK3_9ACTN|nr:VWA domain-containing protein [Actinomadura spongiicola]
MLVTATVTTVALTACGISSSPHGELAEYKRLHAACEAVRPPAVLVAMDATGSSNTAAITGERLTAVRQLITRTAVCGGRVKVVAFSSSNVATVTLLDKVLRPYGATVNARLKRLPALVDQAAVTIRTGYASAMKSLPGGGSDITGQLQHAAEWQRQLGGRWRLHLYLFTDGFHTVGRKLGQAPLSKAAATELATKTPVPKLPSASVTVAGLGRVAGRPPVSAVVEGLVAYYEALCRRTEAAKCTSVTAYAVEV